MIAGKSVLAVIPARGGSKGVPRKNIRAVAGKPLIAWTIVEANKSKYIDRLIISSEDAEIIEVARLWGCEAPFVRPADLSQDDTPGIAPVLHALSLLPGYNFVVLLQPTSPLRTVEDIDATIAHCIRKSAGSCVSVSEPEKSPYWMYKLNDEGRLRPLMEGEPFSRRQDLPQVYAVNGAVYVADCEWLVQNRSLVTSETAAYIMPKEHSVDIDTEQDLKFCEMLLGK